jgi:hypothetical protein
LLSIVALAAGAAVTAAQLPTDEQRALRTRIEERYVVVPLDDGVILRPRAQMRDVRLVEIAGGTVSVNGATVSGRELRERLGGDADAVLRLSYLTSAQLRALFEPAGGAAEPSGESQPPLERPERTESEREAPRRPHRASGDRVRILGDVVVNEDEEITGQVVAVLGSVRVDGEVGQQVVAVLGSVDLGPKAVVRGDIVSVGGRVRRAPGAQTRGGVTEVSVADSNFGVRFGPWVHGWSPFHWFPGFGAVPRLIGSGFRLLLLLILTGIVLVVAGRSVEASAQRVSDNPLKATLVGLVAEVLIFPVLLLTSFVLAVSIIGIPLLLLMPFVVLLLVLMALVGFTGTAAAVGQWVQRRFGTGASTPYVSVCIGVLVILSPLLIGRVFGLAGWPATPFAMLFVSAGFAVELLAWASGFGAVVTNTFTRWQAHRAARV